MVVCALEFYSGIGGLHRALTKSSIRGHVIRAFDWDQSACQVYETNFGKNILQKIDISTLETPQLAALEADLWLLSPSCQPYTVLNPLAKGAADPRAKSFIHLMECVLPELVALKTHPRYLLVENVAGFEAKPLSFSHVPAYDERIWRHIPGHGSDWLDPRSQIGRGDASNTIDEIRSFLDEDIVGQQQHPYAVPDRVLEKWGRLFDIILPSARRSCCFTRGYTKMAERSGSVLQMNEDLDTTEIFNKFIAAQARGDDRAVRILDSLGLRYFSPAELLRIFCFDPVPRSREGIDGQEGFRWPESVSSKTRYRLIGNSINVRVVTGLLDYLFE